MRSICSKLAGAPRITPKASARRARAPREAPRYPSADSNRRKHRSAKLWELRAATSLARLPSDQGKRTEACDLLAPMYRWFTESFDTPVLQDAKALLHHLA
jgi:predicted ATPase